MGQYLC